MGPRRFYACQVAYHTTCAMQVGLVSFGALQLVTSVICDQFGFIAKFRLLQALLPLLLVDLE